MIAHYESINILVSFTQPTLYVSKTNTFHSPQRNLLSNKDCQTNEPWEAMSLLSEKE